MSHFIYVRQALKDLRINPMRTILSLLGLMIWVLSVTVMFGVGEWLKNQILGQLENISTNTFTIVAGATYNPFLPTQISTIRWFTDTDIAFFKESMWFVVDIAPITEIIEPVYVKWEKVEARIVAGDKKYIWIEWIDVILWRNISDQDVVNKSNTVLVTESFVKEYLEISNQNALGKEILIGDQYFTIVWIISEHTWGWFIDVKIVVIPISTAQQKITSDPYYQYMIFEVDDSLPPTQAEKLIKYTLLKRQWASHMEEAQFQVIGTEAIIETSQNISNLLQLALLGIGAISLLVWGIGIMNIMLVTVTERIHEIGIRKAVGAQNHDILIQFLSESVVLSLIGCIVGVLLSWWILFALRQFGVPALLNLRTIMVAVIFSSVTGIVFGVWPARKAARMKPIDALRFE